MRAHTITTNACGRLVLVVGVAVGVLMLGIAAPASASTGPKEGILSTGPAGPRGALIDEGVSTPTPSTPPLTLSVLMPRVSFETSYQVLRERLQLYASASNDSALVARGRKIEKTTKQLAAGEKTRIKAKVKHLKRLREKRTAPRAKVRFAATDEFGQTATAKLGFWLCRNQLSGLRCR